MGKVYFIRSNTQNSKLQNQLIIPIHKIQKLFIFIFSHKKSRKFLMDAFQPLFTLYFTATTSNHPIIASALLLFITTICLHAILSNDLLPKKMALGLGVVSTGMMAAQPNQHIALTSQFLFSLLTLQLTLIALLFTVKRMVAERALKQSRGSSENKMEGYVVLSCILFSNIVGIGYAVEQKLYLELFLDTSKTVQSLSIVVLGFFLVFIFDFIFSSPHLEFSIETRRKTFHLIPIMILPYLSRIHFQFFTLMLSGSFYLFFQLEMLRYFVLPLFKNSFSPKFIHWMKELNSTREPQFWFTHLFLILGLGITYYYFGQGHQIGNISLVLVLGDAMAAIVGKNYGKAKMKGTGKSLEGLLAFTLTVSFLQFFWLGQIHVALTVGNSLVCGLMEVYSGDLDNISLPLTFLAIYQFSQ